MSFWKYWKHQKSRFSRLLDWWDAGKARIRAFSISYGINRQRRLKRTKVKLQRSLDRAAVRLQQGELGVINQLGLYKQQLRKLDMEDILGEQIRSRAIWLDKGETSSKFFRGIEKSNGGHHQFRELDTATGQPVTDSKGLLRTVTAFYTGLYKDEKTSPEALKLVVDTISTTITEEERGFCDGLFTVDELSEAVRQLKSGKSPGLDGIPIELYRSFWHICKDDFMEMANTVLSEGTLSVSQQTGVIRLLHKQGSCSDLSNWRPISLLNSDYKVIDKCLSNRLKYVLPSIIHDTQSCSILGRSISNNLNTVRDAVHLCEKSNSPAAVLSLDQTKAFDRVNRDYLFAVLEKFCFSPTLLKWIRALYNNTGSHVIVNNRLTEKIPLQRGVRQGCPLSPLLYVISAEPLAELIRSSPRIQGITTSTSAVALKTSSYADDLTCFVTNEDGFFALEDILSSYQAASGVQLNRTKSHGLWLGSWKSRRDLPFGIAWSSESIKILGLIFTAQYFKTVSINWRLILKKV